MQQFCTLPREMNVFVLTSEFERTPSVMLEAQWLGLPIVATDAGGTKESFKQDETQVYWQLCRRRRVWHRSSPFI